MNEAIAAGLVRLEDQLESEHFSGVEIWRKGRTFVEDNVMALGSRYQLIDDLRQSIRARDDFVAIAAHELRNAMTPIDGVADLALIAARENACDCNAQVIVLLERLTRLVDDFIRRATMLLHTSRIDGNNFQLEKSLTDLSSLVLSVVRRHEVVATRKGSSLVFAIEEGIADFWDPLAVELVAENLLINAIKFGMGRPISVRLFSRDNSVWLEVRDNGIGMRPEQRDRIFGMFEQAATQHRSSGFGIGLWVANRLVEAMNGRFAVETQSGEGSKFAVEFPRSLSAQVETMSNLTEEQPRRSVARSNLGNLDRSACQIT
jgi:signal transduction histidine kinase